MSTAQWVWAVSLLVTLASLPIGIIRMLAYRTGEVDRPGWLRNIAWLALGIGVSALLVFVASTVFLLAQGRFRL